MSFWLTLVETVAARLATVAVDGRRCPTVLSPRSPCRRCLEVCPTKGLSVANGELTLGGCLDCGLCAAVCPTGALRLQNPSEEELLALLLARPRDSSLFLTCTRGVCEAPKGTLGLVPCLGSLSQEFLLYAAAYKLPVRFFLPSLCDRCQMRAGQELFSLRSATAERLVQDKETGLGVDQPLPRLAAAPSLNRGQGRRRLFRAFWLAAREAAVGPATQKGTQNSRPLPAGLPQTRKQLYLAVRHLLAPEAARLYPEPRLAGECVFCGACARLCPQGVLSLARHGQEASLVLNAEACVACGLCAAVCLFNALRLSPTDGEKKVVVARGWQRRCDRCGKP